jgi:hypothetical protein
MKTLNIFAILVILILGAVPAALAGTVAPGDSIELASYNYTDSAGIMNYVISPNDSHTDTFGLATFCIQDNTYITPNTWYKIASITNTVGLFNPSNTGNGPLNGAVDYLFYRYSIGKYDTYFNGTNGDQYQADFQKLLWSLQGTGNYYESDPTNPWTTDLNNYEITPSLQHSWGTAVLNIIDGNSQDVQNQLYRVPEPTTILLLGIAFAGIALLLRKI